MMNRVILKAGSPLRRATHLRVWGLVLVWTALLAAILTGIVLHQGGGAEFVQSPPMMEIGLGVLWAAGIGAIAWANRRRRDGSCDQSRLSVQELACRDALTNLPNRTLLLDRLAQALFRSRRSGCRTAVLYIGLDGFDAIAEQFGDDAGNMVLREVASRLSTVIREVDTASRVGDEAFAVILGDLPNADIAARVANEIVEAIGFPIALAEEEVTVEAVIGIAFFPDDAGGSEALVGAAAAAMRDLNVLGVSGFSFAGGGSATPDSDQNADKQRRVSRRG